MATKTERNIASLTSIGGVERNSPSRKYRLVEWHGRNYWFGKNGAIRMGRTVSESVSITADIVLPNGR